jgi:SAM-dependent methyltransferase
MRPDTVLRRAPSLTVRLVSAAETIIEHRGKTIRSGPHALLVLGAFAQPARLADAVERLKALASGPQDWMDCTATLEQLRQDGVLIEEGSSQPEGGRVGWDGLYRQVRMLSDQTRTLRFLEGVARAVRPGDVAVDIGTGTGILAIAAARAGATQVYAIEEDAIADVAEAMFRANGVSDRVRLIRGCSTRVDLPQRADVLVCELIGDDPLGERILETVADARRRLLKPGARVVPARLRVMGSPLEIPADVLQRRSLAGGTPDRWREWYHMDFAPLVEVAGATPQVFFVAPQDVRGWRTLADPVTLADVDLQGCEDTAIDASAETVARTAGEVSGLLVYFEVDVWPGIRHGSAPDQVDGSNHWITPAWALPRSVPVTRGRRIRVSYRYRAGGAGPSVDVAVVAP